MWSIVLNKQLDDQPYFEGCAEVDPRNRRVSVGQFPMGTTSSELQGRAIVRIPFVWSRQSAQAVRAWLQQPEAMDWLRLIDEGYGYEMLWSGDFLGHWTEGAWDALLQIKAEIDRLGAAQNSV